MLALSGQAPRRTAVGRGLAAAGWLGAALLIGVNLWLAASVFEPVARDLGHVDYVLVSASFETLAGLVAAAGAGLALLHALAAWHRRLPAPPDRPGDTVSTHPLRVVAWSALSLAPLLTLVSPVARQLPVFAYILYELRWVWWLLLLAVLLQRLGLIATMMSRRVGRTATLASLVVLPVAFATASSPYLRFTDVLHGDEPKYLRICETFYQGVGFDVSKKEPLTALVDDRPRVWRNVRLFLGAIPEEARLLVADARRLLNLSAPPRLTSGQPTTTLFFAGKRPGTVYQLHHPGVSFLLFPSYYLDRRLTGSGVDNQGEFPAGMPALHTTLLALYAAYALALYALLRAGGTSPGHAWIVGVLGMVMLPAGAFAFQIYPEVPAGAAIALLAARLLSRPTPQRGLVDVAYGALAGFLPWLHVRFLTVTLVVTVWALLDSTRERRGRAWFAAGAVAGVGMLSLYIYHLTGSLLPGATYGAHAPVSVARALHGLPAFVFDRVWGLVPHAPLYLLALPGVLLAWRRRPTGVWLIGLLVAAVVVPAASHAYWAAGTTPGRYLVAAVPLLLVFLAESLSVWSNRRLFSAAFVTLAVVSIETALAYNLHHGKEVGPLVFQGFSGWRINLLFPSTGTVVWSATSTDVVLLVAWSLAALVLVVMPLRDRDSARRPWPSGASPVSLAAVAAGLLILALAGEAGARATGNRRSADYLMPAREARERALTQFAALSDCAACYSSLTGRTPPTDALGNDLGAVTMLFRREAPRAGEMVRFLVRPRTVSGEFMVSSMLVDFGDGTTQARSRTFGDVDFEHRYATPGDYAIAAVVRAPDGESLEQKRTLAVLPP